MSLSVFFFFFDLFRMLLLLQHTTSKPKKTPSTQRLLCLPLSPPAASFFRKKIPSRRRNGHGAGKTGTLSSSSVRVVDGRTSLYSAAEDPSLSGNNDQNRCHSAAASIRFFSHAVVSVGRAQFFIIFFLRGRNEERKKGQLTDSSPQLSQQKTKQLSPFFSLFLQSINKSRERQNQCVY